MNTTWNKMKSAVEIIEKNAKDCSIEYKALADNEKLEQKEFETKFQQIDSQWTAAKKKRQQVLDDMAKVCIYHFFVSSHAFLLTET